MLRADAVRLTFGGRPVLRDATLRVAPGEVVGLLGRNGSGKTSLLEILMGARRADYAYVAADGRQLTRPRHRYGRLALQAQADPHPPDLSVRAVLRAYGIAVAEFTRRHPRFTAGLDQPVGHLSYGQARLLTALTVLETPGRYALLDEPFAGLSPLHVDYLRTFLRAGAARKGILLTDQDYRAVLDVSDRHYLLREGALRPFSDPEELPELGYLPPGGETSW